MIKAGMTICLTVVCMMAAGSVASADTIRGIDIEFVTIGNAGNPADTGGTPGCGAVDHNYRIGKYEVTNAQWNTFKTSAGTPTGNPSTAYDQNATYTGAQLPANNISWYEAAQFCNYLTSGDKSKGVYQFSGNNANPGNFLGINRNGAKTTYGMIYFLPTENEWYKAAFYKPNGSGYSLHAFGTDTTPIAGVQSNYLSYSPYYYNGQPWNVGTGMMEQNGTCDMMGNVWEWNETLFSYSYGSYRGLRGGAFDSDIGLSGFPLASYYQSCGYPYDEFYNNGGGLGFRVASIVPEPASAMLMILGAAWIAAKRKR